MKFLISSIIAIPWLIAWVISHPFVLVALHTKWDGKTTIFGNFKYGRGDDHYEAPSNGEYWKQYRFLCWRNPVSNFGKFQLAVKDAPWVWLHDVGYKRVRLLYGWKGESGELPGIRTFVYRPYVLRSGN